MHQLCHKVLSGKAEGEREGKPPNAKGLQFEHGFFGRLGETY